MDQDIQIAKRKLKSDPSYFNAKKYLDLLNRHGKNINYENIDISYTFFREERRKLLVKHKNCIIPKYTQYIHLKCSKDINTYFDVGDYHEEPNVNFHDSDLTKGGYNLSNTSHIARYYVTKNKLADQTHSFEKLRYKIYFVTIKKWIKSNKKLLQQYSDLWYTYYAFKNLTEAKELEEKTKATIFKKRKIAAEYLSIVNDIDQWQK